MHIWDAQKEAWRIAEEKGFHEERGGGRDDTLVRLCLIHTEVSEAAQEVKRHWDSEFLPTYTQIEEFTEEMADTVIRIFDLVETVGGNLEGAIIAKMQKNRERPRHYNTAKEEAIV